MRTIQIRRVYDKPGSSDGFRVLVDRVWPRGVTKDRAAVDLWLKSVAPSTELRKWFGHDAAKWTEFKRRYFAELDRKPEGLDELIRHAGQAPVTLVFSARDTEHNQAGALREYLERRLEKR